MGAVEGDRKSDGDPEREFYRNLVELSVHDAPEPLLKRALSVLVALSGAREAYIELSGPGDDDVVRWSASDGVDAERVDAIRSTISRGIIAQAIATGEVIVTASALTDPRFQDRGSVREHAIESVLCAPIGSSDPIGVVYLQGRRGADDFVPFEERLREQVTLFARALAPIAETVVRRAERVASRHGAERTFDGTESAWPDGVVARSDVMLALIDQLSLVARLDVQILLTGPSGAGKTFLARAIHAQSNRRARPFVEVNCASLPEALLENELFGAVVGAHSAVPKGGLKGKVEAAEGGTLFLDEIGELSLASQAKLLQLLQDRVYYRLGSSASVRADIRIITATNLELQAAVLDRRFRQDLYYRLSVVELRVPGLDERPADLAALASHFCDKAARRHGLPVNGLTPAALQALSSYEWPGNVRQLAHRVESAVLRAHLRGVRRVERRDITGDPETTTDEDVTLQEATRRFQARHVRGVLEAVEWNIREAAERLDVSRATLYRLIQGLGIEAPR